MFSQLTSRMRIVSVGFVACLVLLAGGMLPSRAEGAGDLCPAEVYNHSDINTFEMSPVQNASGKRVWKEGGKIVSQDGGTVSTIAEGNVNSPELNSAGDVVWEHFDPATGTTTIRGFVNGMAFGPFPGRNPVIRDSDEIVSVQGNQIVSNVRGTVYWGSGILPSFLDINSNGDIVWLEDNVSSYWNGTSNVFSGSSTIYMSNINNIVGPPAVVKTLSATDSPTWFGLYSPTISNAGEVIWIENAALVSNQRGILTFSCLSEVVLREIDFIDDNRLIFIGHPPINPIDHKIYTLSLCAGDQDCDTIPDVDDLCVNSPMNSCPQTTHCSDGIQNIDETALDCGGNDCGPCGGGGASVCPVLVYDNPNSSVYEGSPTQSLNGNRMWSVYSPSSGTSTIYSDFGGATSVFVEGSSPNMNNVGDIVWSRSDTGMVYGLFNGLAMTSVPGTYPAINDNRELVYVDGYQIISSIRGPLFSFPRTLRPQSPDINSNGDVVWSENNVSWNGSGYSGTATIYRLNANGGGSPAVVYSRTEANSPSQFSLEYPAISDDGEVIWSDSGTLVSSQRGVISFSCIPTIPEMQGWDADFVGNDSLVFIGTTPDPHIQAIYRLDFNPGCPSDRDCDTILDSADLCINDPENNCAPSAHCTDGAQNIDETGLDCGGMYCLPCGGGSAHCTNAIMDAGETGIDCGGLDCSACPVGGGTTTFDFNSGSIPVGWTVSGSVWTTDMSSFNSGPYSLRSGPIPDYGTSSLEVTRTTTAGNVTFWYRVSSENCCDPLRFYIDGVEQGSWRGETGWAQASYPVSAGTHTFLWVYSKDGSVVWGSDAAWIDDVVFPGGGGGGPAHCTNAIMDADETGIDCGGLTCLPCGGGSAHCTNAIMDADETGLDCGGADCAACPQVPQILAPASQIDWATSINDLGEIVWSQYDSETFYKQVFSSVRGKLTSTAANHLSPSINNLGDVVWYQPDQAGQSGAIYGLVGGQLGRIANDVGNFSTPFISDAGEVLWTQNNSTTGVGQIVSSRHGVLRSGNVTYSRVVLTAQYELVWAEHAASVGTVYRQVMPMINEIAQGTIGGASASNSGEVVWSEGEAGNWESLKLYSSTRGQLTSTFPSGPHNGAGVNRCGDVVFTVQTNAPMMGDASLYRLGSNSPCAAPPEPNEGQSQAITLSGGDSSVGQLSAQGNVEDWYRFNAAMNEVAYVRLNFTTDMDNALTVEIRNGANETLWAANTVTSSPLSPIMLPASVGEPYFIVVRAASGAFGYGIAIERDGDGDGARTMFDNCPEVANADQVDTDGDTLGDVCDNDDDNDGSIDRFDNCQLIANSMQEDGDEDGIGNACDDDWDNDGVLNSADNCPNAGNPGQEDADGDGFGNACDTLCINPQVVAGDYHLVGIQTNGKVVAACPPGVTNENCGGWLNAANWTDIVMLTSGRWQTVGLRSDGTVVIANTDPNIQEALSWTDIVAIAGGESHLVGLKMDGTVVAVGYNNMGQLEVGGWTGIISIAAGAYHTVALKADGTVVSVGWNNYGITDTGTWTDIVAISAGYAHTAGLKADGTVVATGNNSSNQTNVAGWNNIKAIAGGNSVTVGLKTDGTVVAVGHPYPDLLDVGSWTDIVAVGAGTFRTYGVKADGSVLIAGSVEYPGVNTWHLGIYHPDADRDGKPDRCDFCQSDPLGDADGDLVCGNADVCPGDVENDADNDGLCAGAGFKSPKTGDGDLCPNDAANDADNDGLCVGGSFRAPKTGGFDGCPNDAANDADGDGVCGDVDNCPGLANADQANADNDGMGNDCDPDDDNDGVADGADAFPLNPAESVDSDGDGTGDNADPCKFDVANDVDGDGVCGDVDNCPAVANNDQANADGDALGNLCDSCPSDATNDVDGDNVCGDVDNCPTIVNADQGNADGDTFGDLCDTCPNDPANDADLDGACGNIDNCPATANADQADADHDALGNLCDNCPYDAANDADGDGLCGNVDNCPAISNADQANVDGDALGNACDACPNDVANDADGDGVCGDVDNCPTAANSVQVDTDGDLLGDACDPDDDNDGVLDGVDAFPLNSAESVDSDGDGTGDNTDLCKLDAANDADGDGVCGDVDNCPALANADQANADNDGMGNVCDPDDDNDGVLDGADAFPLNPAESVDSDGDGTGDNADPCKFDVANDIDGDGVCGDVDNCPSIANPGQTDTNGNNVGDACDVPLTTATPAAGAYTSTQMVSLSSLPGAAIYYTTNGTLPTTSSPLFTEAFEISAATTTVKFFAVSATGVVEPVKTATYVIDSVKPVIAISSPAPGFVKTTTPTLGYSVDNPTATTVVVKLDGAVINKTSGSVLSIPGQGEHTVRVEATDSAGNSDFREVTFTVDTVAPELTITQLEAIANDNAQTIVGTMEAGAGLSVTSNTVATISAITYPDSTTWRFDVGNLPTDNTLLTFTLTDLAGNKKVLSRTIRYNRSPTSTGVTITTLDNTPSADVTPAVVDPNAVDNFTFAILTQPPHATVEVVNNKLRAIPTPNYYTTTQLDSFTYEVTDSGNRKVSGTAWLIINPSAPQKVTGASIAVQPDHSLALAWTVSTSADIAGYQIYCDNGTGTMNYENPCAAVPHPGNQHVTPPLADATYRFVVRAMDTSGLVEQNTTQLVGRIDTTLPASPQNLRAEPHTGATVRLSWAASPSVDVVKYDIYADGGSGTVDYATPIGTAPSSQLAFTTGTLSLGGTFRFGVIAEDGNGNRSSAVETAPVSLTYADLLIGDVAWTPAPFRFGELVEFTVSITNSGQVSSSAQGFYVGLTLDDKPLESEFVPGSLEAGATITRSFTRRIYEPAKEEDYTLAVTADRFNSQVEANETNNALSVPLGMVADYLVYPHLNQLSYAPGETLHFTAKVANSSNPSRYFSGDVVKVTAELQDGSGVPVAAPQVMDAVAGKAEFVKSMVLPALLPVGTYKLVVTAEDQVGPPFWDAKTAIVNVPVVEAFAVSVSADSTYVLNQSDPMAISGSLLTATGAPIANHMVNLTIEVNGHRQQVAVTTDGAGGFSYGYRPGDGAGGSYLVTASATVNQLTRSAQATFTVEGLYFMQSAINLTMTKGGPVVPVTAIQLVNVGTRAISGIDFSVNDPDLADSVTLALASAPGPATLQRGGSLYLNLEAASGSIAPNLATFALTVAAADGLPGNSLPSMPVKITLVDGTPVPLAKPNTFTIGVNPDAVVTQEIIFRNNGYGTLENVVIQPLAQPWISIVDGNIGTLAPGKERTFALVMRPGLADLGVHEVWIYATASGMPAATPMPMPMVSAKINVIGANTGSLDFVVANDIGNYVQGATVKLTGRSELSAGSVIDRFEFTATTDANGVARFTEVYAGDYDFRVNASGHEAQIGQLTVNPGENLPARQVDLITNIANLTFDATPTTIVDRYATDLTMVIIPEIKPVLVLGPSSLGLAMPPGETLSGTLTITCPSNLDEHRGIHDLVINALDLEGEGVEMKFVLPDGVESPTLKIDYLPPKSELRVPYKVRLRDGAGLNTREVGLVIAVGQYFYNSPLGEPKIGMTSAFIKVQYFEEPKSPSGESVVSVATRPIALEMSQYCADLLTNIDSPAIQINTPEFQIKNTGTETVVLSNVYGVTSDISNLQTLESQYGSGLISGGWNYLQGQDLSHIGSLWEGRFTNGSGMITLEPGEIADLPMYYKDPATAGVAIQGGGMKYGAVFVEYRAGTKSAIKTIPVYVKQICTDAVEIPVAHTEPYFSEEDVARSERFINMLTSGSLYTPPPGFADTYVPRETFGTISEELVILRVPQEISLTREIFTASLDVFPLVADMNNLRIDLLVRNKQTKEPALALFNQQVGSLVGIANITGTASLPKGSGSSASVGWNLIPLAMAGGEDDAGVEYELAAQLNFTVNGINRTIESQWVKITVKPEPLLDIHYAMPEEITAEEPFQVMVTVTNNGKGTASDFRMSSYAPVVLFDTTGQANFRYIATKGNHQYSPGSRVLNFGDIAPGQTKKGVWKLASSVGGYLAGFGATMTHEPVAGLPLTSLVNAPTTELLPVEPRYKKLELKDLHYRSFFADPVDTSSGAHVIERRLLVINGVRPLDFNLSYSSLLPTAGVAGRGWGHNHEVSLLPRADGTIAVRWSANQINSFVIDGATAYVSADKSCRDDRLEEQPDGSFRLQRKDGTVYLFDADGHLQRQTDRSGQSLDYISDASGHLTRIVEPVSGRWLELAYGADNRLKSVSDLTTRHVDLFYDENGDLVTIVDADGTETRYQYNSAGRVLTASVKEIEAEGQFRFVPVFTNTYDAAGRVESQDDALPDTPLTMFNYDEISQPGRLVTTVTDRNGKRHIWVHDRNSALINSTDALDNTLVYEYDSAGRRTASIDPYQKRTTYTYDARGNLESVTGPSGLTTHLRYDERDNLFTVSKPGDPTRYVVRNTYDPTNNRLLESRDLDNRLTSYTYNANGQPEEITTPTGTVRLSYDVKGDLVSIMDSLNNITTYTYDDAGRRNRVTTPSGGWTALTYDEVDNLKSTTTAPDRTVAYAYDRRRNRTSVVDPKGNVTVYGYNDNNKPTRITDPLNVTTFYAYDNEDRLIKSTNARGHSIELEYDDVGRVVKTIDQLKAKRTTQYDQVGNVLSQTDAYDNVILVNDYDPLSYKLQEVKNARNEKISYEYDPLQRLTQITDPLNRVQAREYDTMDRLIAVADPLAITVSQQFDARGNRTRLIDANGYVTEFTQDNVGRLTAMTTAAGVTTTSTYVGDLLDKMTNGRNQTRSFTYYPDGRLQTMSDPNGSVAFTYDENGNIKTVSEGGKTLGYDYDPLDRIKVYTDGDGRTIRYEYDQVGNLDKLTYPDGKEVRYTYDEANRLVRVVDWAGRVTRYEYDLNGRLKKTTRPDDSMEMRDYDSASRLSQIKDVLSDGVTLVVQYDYTYDAAGNVLTETVQGLTEAEAPVGSVAMTYGADSRLSSYNGQPVSYDGDGNMTSGPLNSTASTYVYDSRNRLTGAGGVGYLYDANNRRVGKTYDGVTRKYVVNPNAPLDQVLVETDGAGAPVAYYVYGLGLIGRQDAASGAYSAYHFDRRGSTVALTAIDGTVTDLYAYTPFGEDAGHPVGQSEQPFRYNGRDGVATDENGLYYMRTRYYNPEIRRFTSMDSLLGSIDLSQSLNRYAYVTGRVVDHVDPSGLSPEFDNLLGSEWLTTKATIFLSRTVKGAVKLGTEFVEDVWPMLKDPDAYMFGEAAAMNKACGPAAAAIDGGAACIAARNDRNDKMLEIGDKGIKLAKMVNGMVTPASSIYISTIDRHQQFAELQAAGATRDEAAAALYGAQTEGMIVDTLGFQKDQIVVGAEAAELIKANQALRAKILQGIDRNALKKSMRAGMYNDSPNRGMEDPTYEYIWRKQAGM